MDKTNIQEMAWNDPGNSGDNQWGKGNKSNNSSNGLPPELEDFIGKLKSKFGGLFGDGNKGGSSGLLIIFSFLLIIWLLSGIYIVDPAERGVVLRFGKHVETVTEGPHWHIPYPIEQVEIVDVDRSRVITIGYRDNINGRAGEVLSESLMLTKDENIINAKFAVQYKIKNAEDYLFNVKNPTITLHQVTESAVREVVGKSKMDFVLTEGRAEMVLKVEDLVQKTLDKYGTGIIVTQVTMKDAQPPDQVQEAFADVVKAQEDNKKFINQAEAYRNDIIPKARGKVARIVAEANAYKEQIVAKAEGESSRFKQILTEYKKAPDVTRKRMYIDTMQNVLSKTGKIFIDSNSSNSLFVLPIEKLLRSGVMNANNVEPAQNQQSTSSTNEENNFQNRNSRGRRQ